MFERMHDVKWIRDAVNGRTSDKLKKAWQELDLAEDLLQGQAKNLKDPVTAEDLRILVSMQAIYSQALCAVAFRAAEVLHSPVP